MRALKIRQFVWACGSAGRSEARRKETYMVR